MQVSFESSQGKACSDKKNKFPLCFAAALEHCSCHLMIVLLLLLLLQAVYPVELSSQRRYPPRRSRCTCTCCGHEWLPLSAALQVQVLLLSNTSVAVVVVVHVPHLVQVQVVAGGAQRAGVGQVGQTGVTGGRRDRRSI